MEAKPQEHQHPSGFAVKTIEGFGEKKEYWRIADDLVRGSRLFRSLCTKIYRISGKNGRNNKFRKMHKERYENLMKEFSRFEREVNIEFKKLEKKIKHKNDLLLKAKEDARVWYKKYRNAYKTIDHLQDRNLEVTKKFRHVRAVETFMTAKFGWDETYADRTRAETMLRSIIGYEELKKNEGATFIEIMYLSVGTQLDAFGKNHIEQRFGPEYSRYFGRDIKKLIELGYIRKFDKRQLFYITIDGKARFKHYMSTIYSTQYGLYWNNIFTQKT